MEPTPLVPIVDDVWRWSTWDAPRGLWFNGHALRLTDAFVLVDPVPMGAEVLRGLRAAAPPDAPWVCVITNRDHLRAAAQARALLDAQVLVPAADAAALDLAADAHLVDGMALAGELTTVAVADAKSPGELALSWLSRGLLVLGDAAVGRGGGLAMLADDRFADPAAARRGVAALAALEPEVILVGDGDDLMRGGAAALRALAPGVARGAPGGAGGRGC